MSDDASQQEFLAKLRNMNAETEKFVAEQRKLIAEERKLNRDPWFLVVGAIIAAVAAILTRLIH